MKETRKTKEGEKRREEEKRCIEMVVLAFFSFTGDFFFPARVVKKVCFHLCAFARGRKGGSGLVIFTRESLDTIHTYNEYHYQDIFRKHTGTSNREFDGSWNNN